MNIIQKSATHKSRISASLFAVIRKKLYLCRLRWAVKRLPCGEDMIANKKDKMKKVRTIEMARLTVEEFREAEKLPLVVVLDDVRSMHNVGSVMRTADAFRVERVCLCGITSTPPSAEIHKTALGAEDSVAWSYHTTALEAVQELRQAGYTVFSVEQVEHSTKLQRFVAEKDRRYAVVLGNEVKGVHQEVVDASDGCLEIPQLGTKHSMNVSVTAGIVIYKFAEQLLLKK